MKLFTDFRVLFVRNVKGSLRNPVWLFIGMFQPVLYLLLFAPLLKGLGSVPGFPPGGAYTVFTPGLLVMLALFTTAFAGFGLVEHIRTGFVERLLVTPGSQGFDPARLPRPGHRRSPGAVGDRNPAGAFSWDFRWACRDCWPRFGLMVLTGAMMASCSYALAMLLKKEDTLASVVNTFGTPLLLLSGITLPLTLAPRIIRSIASLNPLAYEVTASRSLFLGNFGDSAIVVSAVVLASLAALAFWWAIRSFKRAAA